MKYTFSYTKPHQHFIDIEYTIDNISTATIEVQLPAWRPGRYELGNFAKNIQQWNAFGGNGAELNFKKLTKDKWSIDTEGNKEVTIKYNYYSNELNAGSTYLDESQLYVNPVNCCLYIPERQNESCEIELQIPSDYEVATGLKPIKGNGFLAKDFHTLVDCPFIASASLKHESFDSKEVKFHLWIQGECEPNWEKIKTDFIAYTDLQIDVFGDFPVNEYHYLFHVLPYKAYHGVEHQNSTVISIGPGKDLMKKKLYDEVLGVSCHELFHTWNVKAIRPIEMQPYNYAQENYSPLGYVAEGVTTYYGDLMLYRSGIFTETEFLKLLAQQVQRHLDNAARFNYSVAESSWDTWLDGYVPGVPNRKLSIYSDGCLLAFMVDSLTLQNTDNTKRLDDIMKLMYERFGKTGKGYSESDYKKCIEEVSGLDFTAFFNNYVWGHNSYEKLLLECLKYVGLELITLPSTQHHEAKFGFKIIGNRVTAVYQESTADKTGISVGDIIERVNGREIASKLSHLLQEDFILLTIKNLGGTKDVTLQATEENFYPSYVLRSYKVLEAFKGTSNTA
ncbi:MAG: M61 family metallopeptidase [Flavobacteriales bacterium]|nr:M61 family metallopeptidase [Flavobacteriales bacterium]